MQLMFVFNSVVWVLVVEESSTVCVVVNVVVLDRGKCVGGNGFF
jgi:hypothetical protein